MFTLLTKEIDFQWSKECQIAFEAIKHKIVISLVLQGPKWNFPFHVHSYASEKTIGFVLG